MKILIFCGIVIVLNLLAIIFVWVPSLMRRGRTFNWIMLGIQLAGLGSACMQFGLNIALLK